MKEPKPEEQSKPKGADQERPVMQNDLERCPRCGLKIENIMWGKTDCPNCGLHFECC